MTRQVVLPLALILASVSLHAQRPPAMRAMQREAVRTAAAPYRGQVVELMTSGDLPASKQRFIQAFGGTLEAAGLIVKLRMLPDGDRGDCAVTPGLRVAYSAPLSGAANAIAEALVRSKAVPGSVPGCSIGGEAVLRFTLTE